MASLPHHKSPCDSQVYIALGVCRGRETLGRGGELKNELKVVGLICTSASVFSGCQSPTRLVTEKLDRKAEERASSSGARGCSSAWSGACRLAHFETRWGIQTGHGFFPHGGPVTSPISSLRVPVMSPASKASVASRRRRPLGHYTFVLPLPLNIMCHKHS